MGIRKLISVLDDWGQGWQIWAIAAGALAVEAVAFAYMTIAMVFALVTAPDLTFVHAQPIVERGEAAISAAWQPWAHNNETSDDVIRLRQPSTGRDHLAFVSGLIADRGGTVHSVEFDGDASRLRATLPADLREQLDALHAPENLDYDRVQEWIDRNRQPGADAAGEASLMEAEFLVYTVLPVAGMDTHMKPHILAILLSIAMVTLVGVMCVLILCLAELNHELEYRRMHDEGEEEEDPQPAEAAPAPAGAAA